MHSKYMLPANLPTTYSQTLMSNAPLFELVNEAHATAELSLAADAAVQAGPATVCDRGCNRM